MGEIANFPKRGQIAGSPRKGRIFSDRKRARIKGRRPGGTFLQLPHEVIDRMAVLGGSATKLLIQLARQYNGRNNGDFSLAWSDMSKKGWKSKATLERAKNELLSRGFIVLTRQGQLGRCGLYAITWKGIDECNGKLDWPANPVPLGWWKSGPPGHENQTPTPEMGPR